MLNVNTLKDQLLTMTHDYPGTPQEAGQRFAAAYKEYAKTAQSVGQGNPVLSALLAAEQVLSTALGSLFASSKDAGTSGSGVASALTAFWQTPPMSFTSIPPPLPGAVTGVTGGAALISALSSMGAVNDENIAIEKVATAIDTFTKTVMVTHPVPSAPPIVGPLT